MNLFAVEYVYDQARTADIDALRPQHLEFLRQLHEDGRLVAAGRWQDAATPGALLLVHGQDHDDVLHLLDGDPFHRAHLVVRRTARPWQPAVGSLG